MRAGSGFSKIAESWLPGVMMVRAMTGANVGQFSAAHFSQRTREVGHPQYIFGRVLHRVGWRRGPPAFGLSCPSREVPMLRGMLVPISLLSTVALCASSMAQFETRASISPSALPHAGAVAVGDFGGNGILDLAVIGSGSDSIQILYGNGDGTFHQGVTYGVGVEPSDLATASLRGNGVLDLVFGGYHNDNVWVMLGNGDGTFGPAVAYPITAWAYMVVISDFTGSGSLDIATTEADNTYGVYCNCVEVLPGNGDGAFATPVTTPLPYGLTAYVIVPGDFNDDGKLDLAAAGESFPNYEVAVLLGDNSGAFNADGHYKVSGAPSSIAAGYFTSDKEKLDLAVVPGLDVLLGDGNGIFGRPVAYSSNMVPSSVVAQDFDGNGVIDLAVAEPGNVDSAVTVYSGSADGSFRVGGSFPVGTHTGLNFIVAADFDGDGKPDLACVNYTDGTVTILLNTGVVSFSPTTPLNFEKQAVGKTSAPERHPHQHGNYGAEDSIDESRRRVRRDFDLRRQGCAGGELQDQRNVLSVEAGSGAGHDQHYRQRLVEAAGD